MKKLLLLTLCAFATLWSKAEEENKNDRTDANLVGHVVCNGEHMPFVSIFLKGTTIGTVTDETGHYELVNLPLGEFTVSTSCLGYKTIEKTITAEKGKTIEVKFDLEEDRLGLDEVVVTGNRGAEKRTESSVIVTSLNPKLFSVAQSPDLKEGLNYCPGLRTENNCGNCGFSQVRMNGMEGPYSQILINSRPIFSGLAGVYGLELIPANMIERVEVIRGGGSALYGSNAIAGTINMILKDPISNTYEFDANTGLMGVGMDGSAGPVSDHNVKFNSSMVSSDSRTGMAIYGNYRKRDPFDANNDSYSNLVKLENTTVGSRLFHRFSNRNKMAFDFFHINEDRRGGDRFDYPLHESNISEAVTHKITTGALDFSQFFRDRDELSVYVAGQGVNRDSYYGADYSLADYGNTTDFTHTVGSQYKAYFGQHNALFGIENRGGNLLDKKLGYYNADSAAHLGNTIVSDQMTNTFGVFGQYEFKTMRFSATVGLRYDNYLVRDNTAHRDTSDVSGNVFSPRINLKYDFTKTLQGRISYSQGYRAPQVFDEDLHIETSGSRRVVHRNAPGLKQETSHSYMASLDYNKQFNNSSLSVLAEGFYTRLLNPFMVSHEPNENRKGEIIATRSNSGAATVQGVNLELNYIPSPKVTLNGGFTVQTSEYDDVQEDFPVTGFFRTPNHYGFLTFDYVVTPKLNISATGNYTGSMKVPHFGLSQEDYDLALAEGEIEEGDVIIGDLLETSNPFFDLGISARYTFRINGAKMQVYGGVKNILNAYQEDLDRSKYRDPGYVYGPGMPRTIQLGVKIGNAIR